MPARRRTVPVGFKRDPATRITHKQYSKYHRYSRVFALYRLIGRLSSGQPVMLMTAHISPEYIRPDNPDELLERVRRAFGQGPYTIQADFWPETRTFGLYLETPTKNQANQKLKATHNRLLDVLFAYRKSIQDLVDANPEPDSLIVTPRRRENMTRKQWKRFRWQRNLSVRSEVAKAEGEPPVLTVSQRRSKRRMARPQVPTDTTPNTPVSITGQPASE